MRHVVRQAAWRRMLATAALSALLGGPALAEIPGEPSDLLVYPEPPGGLVYTMHNDAFTVRVRKPGGAWRDLYEYNVKIDSDGPSDASVVQFDFKGEVEIGVQKNNGDFKRVEVRPTKNAVKPTTGSE